MNLVVFLPNWIGDAVMATPALRALRTRYSEARIHAVLRPYVAEVLTGTDLVDEFHWIGSGLQGMTALIWQLRRQPIDLAILFPNSFRSALLSWLGGCRRRVGYARYARSWLLSDPLPCLRDHRGKLAIAPIVDAYNKLVEHVGCPTPGYRLELATTPTDEKWAEVVWHEFGFFMTPKVVCLNPGAAFGSAKYWPAEYFSTLAKRLARERGCSVLVLCGPAERTLAQEIADRADHPLVQALGQAQGISGLSIGLTKACVRRCDLLITTDSGPRHFAHAFDRPVVTLFGPTHIGWTETYHPRALHLQRQVPCGPCQKRVCPVDHRCMRELTPDEVYRAAEVLLGGTLRASG